MRLKLKKFENLIYPILAAAILLLLWWVFALIIDLSIILPTPKEAFSELFRLLQTKNFWFAVSGTVWRAVRSFLYAVVLAAALAILSNRFSLFEKIVEPFITVLRSVPTMSIILIALLWISSNKSPMLIAFLITFPLLYANFLSSLKGVDERLVQMSKVFGVSGCKTLTKLYIPAVLPTAFDGLKSAVSLSLKVTIASEVMAQTAKSIGLYMQQTMIFFETATLMAWTIVAVVFSYLLELMVLAVKKAVVRW